MIRILKQLLCRLAKNSQEPLNYTAGERTEVRGKVNIRKSGAEVHIGKDGLIHGTVTTESHVAKVIIGNNVFIGGGSLLDCAQSITIEDDVLISHRCLISDSDNHSISYSVRKHDLAKWKKSELDVTAAKTAPVRIGKGAWLGAQVIVLKGVTIGEGAVIGAGAVVTKDIPPWCVAAGNPAKIIRELGEDER